MLCLALDPLFLLTLTILIPELLITIGKNPLTRPQALPEVHAIFTFTLWSSLGDHLSVSLKSYSNLCLPWFLRASALLTMLLLGSAHLSLLLVIIFLFLFPIALKVPLSLDPLMFICFLSSYARPSSSPSLHSFPGYLHSISMLQLSPSWNNGSPHTLDRILALMTSCMASGKLINFSLFTHLLNGDNSIHLTRLLWILNEVTV